MTDDELKPLLEEIIRLLRVANLQRDGGRDPHPWVPYAQLYGSNLDDA